MSQGLNGDGQMSIAALLTEVRNDVKSIMVKQAEQGATLDALKATTEQQIQVLFDQRRAADERVRRIELDYTPKGEFEKRGHEHDKAHEALNAKVGGVESRITSLESKMLRLSMMAGAVVAVLQAIGYALARRYFG